MSYRRSAGVTVFLGLGAAIILAAGPTTGAGFVNWPGYQSKAAHGSYNAAATAITTSNAATLPQAWKWLPAPPTMTGQPGAQLNASPTVYDGRIYIGSKTGVFSALDEATGAVVWQRFVGYRSGTTCHTQGFVSTATVATDPVTGAATVYVAAPTGEVYAFDASDGTVRWRATVVTQSTTVNDYFLWSSPAVANDHVYLGTSSACDKPLVRAGVVSLNQSDGSIAGNYYTQAATHKGGSVWSSVAVDPNDGSVFVSTGNPSSQTNPDDAYSIVRLNGQTMQKTDIWTVPLSEQTFDADFGASPTLFDATIGGQVTHLVAACSKNGMLYALDRANLAAGPVWSTRMGQPGSDPDSCIGGSAWDGRRLYQGSDTTTIAGTTYPGSIRAIDPATGVPIWEVGLPSNVINTPTVNGSGVVAIGTFNTDAPASNTAYLLDATSGSILRTFDSSLNGGVFGQMVFADNYVFLPSVSNGMRAFRAAITAPNSPPIARMTSTCTDLTCSFDGRTSSDSDGSVQTWAWDFGDGGTDTGSTVSHTYSGAGTYTVRLTVTDNNGGTGTSTTSVTVSPTAAGIAFRGSATANGNLSTASVVIPSQVRAGDGLLLFTSVNSTTPSLTFPSGWQQVGEQLAGTMRTVLWQRVASATDAGTTVKVSLSNTAKVDVQLLAYSGTSPNGPVVASASAADATATALHKTPVVQNVPAGDWVVSYWADKSSSTTAWTPPAGQTVRPHPSYTSGTAYVTSLITDSGAPVSGTYGGLTASVNAPSSKATMLTVTIGGT